MAKTFLKAEWRKLAMANYAVDPKILEPYVPYGTELDFFNDTCYVSLVGFRFVNTRVKGFRIPYHVNFEEVNLRFYVRYMDGHEWKRGVVFIREIVPRRALTFIANTIYKEKYATMPMGNTCSFEEGCVNVEYTWKKGKWHSIRVNCSADPQPITPGSEEEFITEHYWGYTKITNNSTSEYGVEHPRWEVYPTKEYSIDVDFGLLYGKDFAFLQSQEPVSVFLAEGSEIVVKEGKRIKVLPHTSLSINPHL